jgi:hypothetical protein
MHLDHYCYLQDHRLLGVVVSWRVSMGSNCSCSRSDQSDRSVNRIKVHQRMQAPLRRTELCFLPSLMVMYKPPEEWNKQYNWTLYFLTTDITFCLTTKVLVYSLHMVVTLKTFYWLFHIYQSAQCQKHVSMHLLKTNWNKRCLNYIVTLSKFNLCINSYTKTRLSGKINKHDLGLHETCYTEMIHSLKSNMPDSFWYKTVIPYFVKIHSGNPELSMRMQINHT